MTSKLTTDIISQRIQAVRSRQTDELDLRESLVMGLGVLSGLSNLRSLDLSFTPTADLRPISDLLNLQHLRLRGTPVREIAAITNLSQLTLLDLGSTNVKDIAPIARLSKIEFLYLSQTRVSELYSIAKMNRIVALDISGTNVTDLSPIANLEKIEELRIEFNSITSIQPLERLNRIRRLSMNGTTISELRHLPRFARFEYLDLRNTSVEDLRPLRDLQYHKNPNVVNIRFDGCAATSLDPQLDRISKIEHMGERFDALMVYLKDWVPPGEEPTNIETVLRGPILSDTLTDVSKPAERFEATTLTDEPDKEPDAKFGDIVGTLTFASEKLGATDVQNRLGRDVAQSFREFHRFIQQDPLNPRILRYLTDSIRGAISNPDTAAALDDFDLPLINGFVEESDALLNGYFALSIAPPAFEISTDPDVLSKELFPKLDAAKKILADADAAGLFAPSVSDALEMLHRRAEGARKRIIVTDDPVEREAAVAELRRTSVLATSYLGRIKGRLTQWVGKQVAHAKENPGTATLTTTGLVTLAKSVIASVTPIFEALWKLIGNLPLPF